MSTRHFLLLFILFFSSTAFAVISLQGSDNQRIVLAAPAQRIITLAPNLTDMLQALGAGAQIVAASDDHHQRGAHQKSVSGFLVVSDSSSINYELLVSLRPDVVVAWSDGTPRAWVEKIRALNIPVLVSGALTLEGIAPQIIQLGALSGHEKNAQKQAADFTQKIAALKNKYQHSSVLPYFYQAWLQPLYSLNSSHLMSQALALCRAENIVKTPHISAPLINPEFVVKQKPVAILFSENAADTSRKFWMKFTDLRAQLVAVNDTRLTRPGPDILPAIIPVCERLDALRKH